MDKPLTTVYLTREDGTDKNRRFCVQGSGLHCGEGLHLVVQGKVLRGRVEFNDWLKWYWVWEDPETDVWVQIPLKERMMVAVDGGL